MSKPIVSHTTESGWLISHDEENTTYAERDGVRFQVIPGGRLVIWNHAHAPFVQIDIETLSEVLGIVGAREGLESTSGAGTVHVDRYAFSASAALRLGTMAEFPKDAKLEAAPEMPVNVRRITMNVPSKGFFTITRILVGDGEVFKGELDAFAFSPGEQPLGNIFLDNTPAIGLVTPSDKVSVEGVYLGEVPEGCEEGKPYWLAVSFQGEAEFHASSPSARFEVAATEDHWSRSADHAPILAGETERKVSLESIDDAQPNEG